MADYEKVWQESILSQYSNSETIKLLVEGFSKEIQPCIDLFFKKIFDLDTAEGIGLDIWGRIVGVERILKIEEDKVFGFHGQILNGFDNENFVPDDATSHYILSDEAYRRLIYCKALANISDSTMPDLKRLLKVLMNTDEVMVIRSISTAGVMKLRLIFGYYVDKYAMAIMKQYGLLNIGAGVGCEWYQVEIKETFGFDGSNLQPFNQGIFAPYSIQDVDV